MSEETRTIPIVVRVPAKLGLTGQQTNTLETKWREDLINAAAASEGEAKLKWIIRFSIEIKNE